MATTWSAFTLAAMTWSAAATEYEIGGFDEASPLRVTGRAYHAAIGVCDAPGSVLALGPQNICLQPYLQRSADRAIEEQQAIKRAQERAKLALATPGGTSRGRDKSRESADLEEDDDAWVFEMESARSVPRQPCLPDVKSAFHFRPA